MADDIIQKEGDIDQSDVVQICQKLKRKELRLLSLRECCLELGDYQRILKLAGNCKCLQQLSLNVGIVKTQRHVELLSGCIDKNQNLSVLQ